MKSLKKGLSVLLSLVLCGSMVIPAFAAATFTDLNNAVNEDLKNGNGTQIDDTNQYGYAGDGNGNYGIIAWDQGDTRHVQLNENVNKDSDSSPTSPVSIGENQKVEIDMQKHVIDGGGQSGVFDVSGDLTVKNGTIQGGHTHTNGGAIYAGKDSTVTLEDTVVTNNTAAGNGDGIYAAEGATINLEGDTEVSNNGEVDVYLEYNEETQTGAQLNAPEDVVWTDTKNEETTYTGEVNSTEKADSLSLKWANPTTGGNGGGYDGGDTEMEITDPDVPLAEGPVSCAEFIHKMWVLDGEPAPLDDRGLPEGVDEGHEFAPAIAWAASADIVPVDGFDAEALLTVALAREYLTSFAAYADMAMPELVTLTGKDDDLVLNSDGVLDEFFGEKDSE